VSRGVSAGEEFRPILQARARGPAHLGFLEPELCERAMTLILAGVATPAQIGGFLLVGRAVGDSPAELAAYARPMRSLVRTIEAPPGPPVVTVTGGFDGKLRTFNVGAAASLVAAAAGGRVLMLGCEGTPPKEGRTVFDALRNLGVTSPHSLEEAGEDLAEHDFAATSMDHYLPALHALLDLRHEIARRTVLNVVEKIISPIPGSCLAVGITHRPFLKSIPAALVDLGVDHALVFQAIEGSDEAPLDGNSSLVRIRGGAAEEFRIPPESIGLSRATRAHIPWKGAEDEARNMLNALGCEEGPAKSLILYNAALRLWSASEDASLAEQVEKADDALRSGTALELLSRLRRPATVEAFSA
jgi:anthranilate phosphoribosyltransferase